MQPRHERGETFSIGGLPLRRVGRLPRRALVAVAALLLCSAAPAVLTLAHQTGAAPTGDSTAGVLTAAAAALWIAVVLLFEPPRSASPLAYARQLHARFLELQSTFDADDRRRPGEGKEKEDDRVSSEP